MTAVIDTGAVIGLGTVPALLLVVAGMVLVGRWLDAGGDR